MTTHVPCDDVDKLKALSAHVHQIGPAYVDGRTIFGLAGPGHRLENSWIAQVNSSGPYAVSEGDCAVLAEFLGQAIAGVPKLVAENKILRELLENVAVATEDEETADGVARALGWTQAELDRRRQEHVTP